MNDFRVMLDTFASLVFLKVIAEPVAIRVGRAILRWADRNVEWIPNWLYEGRQEEE